MGEIGKHKCSSIVDHRIEKIIFTLEISCRNSVLKKLFIINLSFNCYVL